MDAIYIERFYSKLSLTDLDCRSHTHIHTALQSVEGTALWFVMTLEPRAMGIRNNPGIKPIQVSNQEHQISLFADDILLYLSDLKNTIPTLINVLNQFWIFSGYTVNQSKSSILFLNEQERTNPTIQHLFTESKEGLEFLGITVTPRIKNKMWWLYLIYWCLLYKLIICEKYWVKAVRFIWIFDLWSTGNNL